MDRAFQPRERTERPGSEGTERMTPPAMRKPKAWIGYDGFGTSTTSPGAGYRLRHIGEAFLRAERRHNLGVGVQLHAEAALVIARLCAAQPGDAL